MSELDDLKLKVEELENKLEHTNYWYATRHERLREYANQNGFLREYSSIMANGTLGYPDHPYEPPTYAILYNDLVHKVESLNETLESKNTQIASLVRERDELRSKLMHHEADSEQAVHYIEEKRNQALEFLAQVYDRFACAKCSRCLSKEDCPCGFHGITQFLNEFQEYK